MKLLPTHLLTRCHKITCFFLFDGFPNLFLKSLFCMYCILRLMHFRNVETYVKMYFQTTGYISHHCFKSSATIFHISGIYNFSIAFYGWKMHCSETWLQKNKLPSILKFWSGVLLLFIKCKIDKLFSFYQTIRQWKLRKLYSAL